MVRVAGRGGDRRPYRISVNQVLKRAWKRYGIDGKGFSLGGQSPPMTRQRYASMRKLDAGDQSSTGWSSSSRGTTSSRSSASSSSLDIEVVLMLCEMKNQLQSC